MMSPDSIHDQLRQHPRLIIADDFELVVQRMRGEARRFHNGSPSRHDQEERLWISLRLIHRKQPGRAITTAGTPASIQDLVQQAFDSSARSRPDPWFRFPLWKAVREVESRESVSGVSLESRFASFSDPPELVDEAYEQWETETRIFRKSERAQRRHRALIHTLRLSLAGQADSSRFRIVEERAYSLPRESAGWMEALVREAHARRAASPFTPTGRMSAIISPRALTPVLRRLSRWFCADQVQSGRSPLTPPDGQLLFSPVITLVDDGQFAGGIHCAPFDMEGVPTLRTILIDEGRHCSLLYDTYTATRDNCLSTGNLLRPLRSAAPSLGPSQLMVTPTETPLSGLYAALKDGIILETVESLDGIAENDPILMLRGSGWHLRGGEAQPVRDIVIRSDVREMFRSAALVGDDFALHGDCGSPSILFENLPIGG